MKKPKRYNTFGMIVVLLIYFTSQGSSELWGQTASSWPQFLGAQRNGTSSETNLIDRIPVDGLPTLWRVAGGVGMSAVVADGSDVVTMVRRAGRQVVLCLDAATGKQKWTYDLAPAYNNAMGNGTRATPTITKDSVVVFSGEGILAAVNRQTGQKLWQVDTLKTLGGEEAEYGMASSPLVVDGKVYVTVGAEQALIAALDLATGKMVWKSGNGATGYSSPVLLNLADQPTVVVFGGEALFGFEPASGKQLWRYDFSTNYNCNIALPIQIGQDLFISAGEDHGSVRLKVSRSGETFSVKEVWSSLGKRSPFRNEWQTSLVIGQHLYGMDNVGGAGPITHLTCIDAGTGELVWREARFGKGNFSFADGKLFIATVKGELVLAKVDSKGYQELGRQPLLSMTRQSPTLCAGKLYLRDDKEIVCVNVAK